MHHGNSPPPCKIQNVTPCTKDNNPRVNIRKTKTEWLLGRPGAARGPDYDSSKYLL